MTTTTEIVNRGIRILLIDKGMSLKTLREGVGLKPNYFSTHINGHRPWSLADLDGIAKIFGLEGATQLLQTAEQKLAA